MCPLPLSPLTTYITTHTHARAWPLISAPAACVCVILLLAALGRASFFPILLKVRVRSDRDGQAFFLKLHAEFLGGVLGYNGDGGEVVRVGGQRALPGLGAGQGRDHLW